VTSLALVGWAIHPNADGTVQIGGAAVPAWMAGDIATRIAEAAGNVPVAQAARVRVREFLDRLFASAQLVPVRLMSTGKVSPCPAYREGPRVHVRLGDTVTAWCIRHDDVERARGMLVQWSEDELAGFVTGLVPGFVRVSVPWTKAAALAAGGVQ